ncbi:hypothetical protein LIA77_10838 [Sarocladium implicatum]|nr:hypothetical protein LIA77_10838 [Sarocladium implicatum]
MRRRQRRNKSAESLDVRRYGDRDDSNVRRAQDDTLLTAWPSDDQGQASGLNCFIVVALAIYACLSIQNWALPEQRAPDVKFPWDDDPTLQKAWLNNLDSTQFPPDTLVMSFQELCLRSPTNKLWYIEEIHPVRGYAWKEPDSAQWKSISTAPEDVQALITNSLHPWHLQIELTPQIDMASAVSALFQPQTVEGHTVRKLPSSAPLLCLTAVVQLGDSELDFNHFCQFRFRDDTDHGPNSLWYSLVAMVVQRRGESGDRVRIWERYGKQIIPMNLEPGATAYATQDWSTSDLQTDDQVFLLYSWCPGPSSYPFPERHIPRPANPKINKAQKLINAAMVELDN